MLIPEIPYKIEPLVRMIRERSRIGQTYSIVVVGEGARPLGGEQAVAEGAEQIRGRGVVRLGGAGKVAADLLAREITEHEIRVTVLGHLARGGTPTAQDRILGTRFGARAVELVDEGRFDHMVALRGTQIVAAPMAAASKTRYVDLGGELVRAARQLGMIFGDE